MQANSEVVAQESTSQTRNMLLSLVDLGL